jgi:hypothetical protein
MLQCPKHQKNNANYVFWDTAEDFCHFLGSNKLMNNIKRKQNLNDDFNVLFVVGGTNLKLKILLVKKKLFKILGFWQNALKPLM